MGYLNSNPEYSTPTPPIETPMPDFRTVDTPSPAPTVTNTPLPTSIVPTPSSTPISLYLALQSDPNLQFGDGGDYPIILVSSSADTGTILVGAEERPSSPDWSWNGEYLAYDSFRRFPPPRCILEMKSREAVCFTAAAIFEWSANSEDFLYVPASGRMPVGDVYDCYQDIYRGSYSQVKRNSLSGEPFIRMMECIQWLRWSPSGEHVLIATFNQETYANRLFLFDLKSESSIAIGPDDVARASWSPNGKWIAISRFCGELYCNKEIAIVDIHSMQTIVITSTQKLPTIPTWSPDGNWLAYFVNEGPGINPHTEILDIASHQAERLPIKSLNCHPFAWTSDSQHLIMLCNADRSSRLVLYTLSTGKLTVIIPRGVSENIDSVP
jgi:hypothetical protein